MEEQRGINISQGELPNKESPVISANTSRIWPTWDVPGMFGPLLEHQHTESQWGSNSPWAPPCHFYSCNNHPSHRWNQCAYSQGNRSNPRNLSLLLATRPCQEKGFSYLGVGCHLAPPDQAGSSAQPDAVGRRVDIDACAGLDVKVARGAVCLPVAPVSIACQAGQVVGF
jgi:hypothetical protein